MIPWADPRATFAAHEAQLLAACRRVLQSGHYMLGAEVEGFEDALRQWQGYGHAVGVGSGTQALMVGLRALGVEPGDEVITVSHTALATVAAIIAVGAKPVLVDVDARTLSIDVEAVYRARTARTRAVVAVHLYGYPVPLDALVQWCRAHSIALVEDCAQAQGARSPYARVGAAGDAACFSFYPTKNLGTVGDAGAIIFRDPHAAQVARQLRCYGWDDQREAQRTGWNARLDELQAAMLRVLLPHVDTALEARGRIAERYLAALEGVGDLILPATPPAATHGWHLFVVRTARRAALRAHLRSDGVGVGVHYDPPIHRQPGYRDVITTIGTLAVTDEAARQVLSLPLYPQLTVDQQSRVVDSIRAFFSVPAG